jgi:hypothetical protein
VARVLAEQNPWHRNGLVPDALAHQVERPLGQRLWRRITSDRPRRFHLVLGPRRVGKTTVMYQTARHLLRDGVRPERLWWLRMDHPLLMQQSLGNLVGDVVKRTGATLEDPVHVLLDEVVYASEWELWLKTFYDDRWPVRLVATSSATAALRDGHRESGVGRWDEHLLLPYQFSEYLDLLGLSVALPTGDTLADTLRLLPTRLPRADTIEGRRRRFLLIGGFPELISLGLDADDASETSLLLQSQQQLRGDAVERAIYKDIPQSFGIESPMMLERLLYVLAGQVGGIVSASSVSTALDGLAQPTVDRYISYLEQTFLVFRLQNYSGSEESVQRRGRKVFFLDGAVRNAALQRGLAPLSDPVEMGLLQENLAAAALHALALTSGGRLFHWRHRGDEVDLILDDARRPLAFEIASSTRHHRRGLMALLDRYPRFRGGVYLVSPEAPTVHPDDESTSIGTLGLDQFLLAVGRQSLQALTSRIGGSMT